jgi:peroxiredoxin
MKKFKQQYKLPFILLSDENKKIQKLFGCGVFLVPACEIDQIIMSFIMVNDIHSIQYQEL